MGYAKTQEEFDGYAQQIRSRFEELNRLYDRFHEYQGVNNICTINRNAGAAPVAVSPEILDLLEFSVEMYDQGEGVVNIALGPVLAIWHDYMATYAGDAQGAVLPPMEDLEAANAFTDITKVQIDRQAGTVYLEEGMLLDVGAVAKGYAVEQVCQTAPEGLLISVGGNVRATGPKPQDKAAWVVGVQNPEGSKSDYLHTIYVKDVSVVTSGDYQRYYTVEGVPYHHIIDPATLYPAGYWRSVTVLCPDSGLADGLSTALFTLPQAEGQALLDLYEAQAMWVDLEGSLLYSPGFQPYIRT